MSIQHSQLSDEEYDLQGLKELIRQDFREAKKTSRPQYNSYLSASKSEHDQERSGAKLIKL